MIATPLRRTLDGLLLRWLGIYILAASTVVGPILCGVDMRTQDTVHAVLPVFLIGFIVFHLFHRRTHVREDGWRRAFEVDPGSARFALMVGSVVAVGVLASMIAIFCPHGEPVALEVALGIWLPITAPLYAGAVWLAVECSIRQLGRSADAADREYRNYWRRLTGQKPGDSRQHS